MSSGFQARTNEYGWPVVATTEPKGVRTIRGYITIFEHMTQADAPLAYRIVFSDAEGRPFQNGLDPDDLDVFYDAAQAALVVRNLRSSAVPGDRPAAGDIIR